MQVTIDRSECVHHPTACEQCFGEFLRRGVLPDRCCINNLIDDGHPEITVRIKSGKYFGSFVVTDENREEIIYHGWMQFAQLPPEAFDEAPPSSPEA